VTDPIRVYELPHQLVWAVMIPTTLTGLRGDGTFHTVHRENAVKAAALFATEHSLDIAIRRDWRAEDAWVCGWPDGAGGTCGAADIHHHDHGEQS
jgi:hypothetical protein